MADYIYYVTVSGSTFLIDGEPQAELGLKAGLTYRFDISDSSCASQTFKFSTTSDGTHGGGSEYTTNVTVTGTAGSSGAVVDLVVPSSTGTLYYYNGAASGYGGTILHTTGTYVSTANLGLRIPLPGASDDVWASHLNASLRTIDSVVEGKAPLDSPTFTGTISGGTLGSGVVFPTGVVIGMAFLADVTNGDGGSSTASAQLRTLNTAVFNINCPTTIASNEFSFDEAGTYVISASAPAFESARHILRLSDDGGSTFIGVGSAAFNDSSISVQTRSHLCKNVTITSSQITGAGSQRDFGFWHIVDSATTSNGLGVANLQTSTEQYLQVQIFRLA